LDQLQLMLYTLQVAWMGVLLAMGGMMYFRWRSQFYLILFSSTGLGLLSSIAMLSLPNKFSTFYMFFLSLLTCSVVLIQLAVYRILYTKRQEKLYIHLAGTGLTLITAAGSLMLPPEMASLLLVFIVGAVTMYSLFKLFPEAGTKMKNTIALASYFVHILLYTVAAITKMEAILLSSLAFLAVFLLLTFMQLFERVIEIMQAAAYTSTRDEVTGFYTRKHFIQQANQALLRRQVYGVVYILFDFSQDKDYRNGQAEEIFRKMGPVVQKYTDRFGFSCRYEQDGVAVIINKSSMDLKNLTDSLKLNLSAEVTYSFSIGYMNITGEDKLEELLLGAKQGALRTKEHGMDKMFDINQSRILMDGGVEQ